MKSATTSVLTCFLAAMVAPCVSALADDGVAMEQKLLEAYENGRKEVEEEKEAPIPLVAEPVEASKRVASQPTTDQLIEELVEEVEGLKNKVVVTRASVLATTQPRQAPQVGARTVYSYRDGGVYEVRAGIDKVTDVSLQAGERLTSAPMAGDTVRWKIGILESGQGTSQQQHLIIKPLDVGLETNLIVTTDRRVYHLRLLASDWAMAAVSWRYPDDEERENQAKVLQAQREENVQTAPEELYFEYELSEDSCSWCPVRVFDDGMKTYIQMPKEMRVAEAPVLFLIEEDEPVLVNYRVKGDYFVVDRLFKEAELRVGAGERVRIESRRGRKTFFERIFS